MARRRAYIDAYKVKFGCIDCGYCYDPVALDLDHDDPSLKIDNVSELIKSASWRTVLAEIEKCVVRCANCHRIKTHR